MAVALRRSDDGGTPPPQTPPEFTGGLGPDGVSALEAFINSGGTIVALNHASEVYTKKGGAIENGLDSIDRRQFYIPGSILRGLRRSHQPDRLWLHADGADLL